MGHRLKGIVASVLVPKYAWDLPLYRQAHMLGRQSMEIKRSSARCSRSGPGNAPTEPRPVHHHLRELILASAKMAVDETIAPVLDLDRSHA